MRRHWDAFRQLGDDAAAFMRTSGCALCALIVVFAIGRAVAGENVRRHGLDAESQAVEMLASIGCKPGLNPATKRYAAIGLYRCFIAKDTVQEDVERIRSKGIRCALLEAIGNMAFWLKSDICITRIAEEFFKVHGNDVTSWSEFCNRVNAECKYKDMPVNEVGFGESRNRITRRKQYWWACGVKLMSLKSMAR